MQALHFICTVLTVHINELKGSTEASIQLLKHPLTVPSCGIVKINLFMCNMAKYSTSESTCECTCACSECRVHAVSVVCKVHVATVVHTLRGPSQTS